MVAGLFPSARSAVDAGRLEFLREARAEQCVIDPDAGVYPMVGPGQPYEAMITGDWIPSRKKVDVKPPGASEMF